VTGHRRRLKAIRRNVQAGGRLRTEEIWKEIEEKVKNATMKHRRKILRWKLGRREWYNKEWRDKKRGLRRALRRAFEKKERLKKKNISKEVGNIGNGAKNRRSHEEKEEAKIRSISTEQEVWKYINKYRKKRRKWDK